MSVQIRTGISKSFFFFTWAATLLSASWLAFSYLLPEDLAGRGPIYTRLVVIAFFGRVFTFQTGIALAVAVVAALVGRRKWLFIAAAISCALPLGVTGYACRPRKPPESSGPALRVMAINLFVSNHRPEKITDQITLADPDVIVMEEYTEFLDGPLHESLKARYPFQCVQPRTDASGLAIYSNRPFVDPPVADMAGQRVQIRTAIKVGDRSVALYAVHPRAPQSRWSIVQNRLQVLDYIQQVQAEKLPAILAGDWNFTSETANASALNDAGLTNAFDLAGHGRGTTWPIVSGWMRRAPGVRLDHVYITSTLTCTRYQTGGFDGSDHLPIITDIAFGK